MQNEQQGTHEAVPPASWRVKVGALVIMLILVGLGLQLISYGVMVKKRGWAFLSKKSGDGSVRGDPEVGWSYTPGFHKKDYFGPGKDYTINANGFRGTEDYTPAKPPGRYRIMIPGDSFTNGSGVSDDETFAARLQALDPRLQTINLGLGGGGVDQSVLWYEREAKIYEHDLVMLSFIRADFDRMIGDTFNTTNPKPRFMLVNGKLELTGLPLPDYGIEPGVMPWITAFPKSTMAYKVIHETIDTYLVRNSYDRYGIAWMLFDRVIADAKKNGRQVALAFLPVPVDLEINCPTGDKRFCLNPDPAEGAVKMKAYADKAGIAFIDPTPAFRAVYTGDFKPYFVPDTHYSDQGQDLVARYMLDELRKQVPGFPQPVDTATVTHDAAEPAP